jgi:hypothetical protein
VIPLILDGENAWETFPDGGESFLRQLYAGIEADRERLRSRTIEEFFRENPPRKEIKHLHTGSWIGSNFEIWIGEEEENRAWDLLGETRTFLQTKIESGTLSAQQQCAALREIYSAEGSDWFWWYGPDFTTENDALFDELFRQHLKNVYAACGDTPPAILDQPIIRTRAPARYTCPTHSISPVVDGKRASFYDWSGAGVYTVGLDQGAMYRSEWQVTQLQFGNDLQNFYLRVDLSRWDAVALSVHFRQPEKVVLKSGQLHRRGLQEFTLTLADGTARTRKTLAAVEIVE